MEAGLSAPGGSSGPIGLTALVDALRAAGFRAGPAEAIAAARLLQRLQSRPDAPQEAQGWRLWLRPVFCSNREEQSRFDAVFADWLAHWQPQRTAPAAGDVAVPGTSAVMPPDERPPDEGRGRRGLLIGVLLLAAFVAALLVWRAGREPAVVTPVPAPAASAAQALQPAPVEAAAPGDDSAPRPTGYAPAWREARSLRPAVALPLCLAPLLLAWLLGGAPPLALLRGQRRSARSVVLDTRALEAQARALLPPLEPGVSGRLERHIRSDSDAGGPLARRRRIDERRTVEALLRQPGRVRLLHRAAPLRPSYLVLVDARDETDPRGRIFVHWAERLRAQGLAVEIRTFAPAATAAAAGRPDAAPVSRPLGWREGEALLPLDALPEPPAGQRLVVVGEAAPWVTADGRWQPWYRRARLHRWRDRAFFTPTELREWGDREAAVEAAEHSADPGFLMLPMDEAALEAWSVLLASGHLPVFALSEPQRFPRLLSAEGFDPWPPPDEAEREKLVAQLMLYLGDAGFRWLCMLAVAPLVRWELTVLLGQALFEDAPGVSAEEAPALFSRAYRRLARLPWLRGGHDAQGERHEPGLPVWLRLRLLDELPAAAAADVRERVDRLLSTLHEGPGTLSLGLEAPPERAADAQGGAPAAGKADAIYLGLLSGLTPRQLAQRVPEGWEQWLRPRRRGAGVGEWLRKAWARLTHENGLPWAERKALPWVAAAALGVLAAVSMLLLARLPASEVPPWLEPALFSTRAVPVEVPVAAGVRDGALSPDGRSVALLARDGRVVLADATTGRVLRGIGSASGAEWLKFDGQAIFACGKKEDTEFAWSVEGRALPTSPFDCVAPGRDPRRVDSTESGLGAEATGGQVRLMRPPLAGAGSESEPGPPVQLSTAAITGLRLDTAGSRLLALDSAGGAHLALLWQPPAGQTAQAAAHAAISDDGGTVAYVAATGQVFVQPTRGEAPSQPLAGPEDALEVALSPDGRRIAVRTRGDTVREGPVGGVLDARPLPTAGVLAACYTADGRLLAVAADGGVWTLAAAGWQQLGSLAPGNGVVASAQVHRSGLAAGVTALPPSMHQIVWRWPDGTKGSALQPRRAGESALTLTVGSQGRSLWWAQADGAAVGVLEGSAGPPRPAWAASAGTRVAAHDDARQLSARVAADGALDFVDARGAASRASGGSTDVLAVQALPGGRWLVTHRSGRTRIEDPAAAAPWPDMATGKAFAERLLSADGRVLLVRPFARERAASAKADVVQQSAPPSGQELVQQAMQAAAPQLNLRFGSEAARWWALPPVATAPAWSAPGGAWSVWHPVLLMPAVGLLVLLLAAARGRWLLQRLRAQVPAADAVPAESAEGAGPAAATPRAAAK
jgi:uncharacterized protein with von Willebrand factor type A (vWA) domain